MSEPTRHPCGHLIVSDECIVCAAPPAPDAETAQRDELVKLLRMCSHAGYTTRCNQAAARITQDAERIKGLEYLIAKAERSERWAMDHAREWSARAERAEAEVANLRKCVEAADVVRKEYGSAMHAEGYKWESPTMRVYDAARRRLWRSDRAGGRMIDKPVLTDAECDAIWTSATSKYSNIAICIVESIRAAFAAGAASVLAVPRDDPVGKVCGAEEGRPYKHFKRLREPRLDEVGAYLYAIHDAALGAATERGEG